MRDIKQIKKLVGETLKDDFGRIKIYEIRVHEDVIADGDIILRIDVIFEGAPKDLNANKLSSATGRLRSKLDNIKETAFPLLSFISRDEEKLARA